MRTLSATINDYALRSPRHLESDDLAEAMVCMLENYLLEPRAR